EPRQELFALGRFHHLRLRAERAEITPAVEALANVSCGIEQPMIGKIRADHDMAYAQLRIEPARESSADQPSRAMEFNKRSQLFDSRFAADSGVADRDLLMSDVAKDNRQRRIKDFRRVRQLVAKIPALLRQRERDGNHCGV